MGGGRSFEGTGGQLPNHSVVSAAQSWPIQAQEAALERVSGWIIAADGKLSAIISIDVAMVASLVALAARSGSWTESSGVWLVAGNTLILSSLLMIAFSTSPQLAARSPSLIFFGDIASLTSAEYASKISARTPMAYLEDLTAQCHRNSEIAFRKYRWIRYATIALLLGVGPWLLALFFVVGG